MTETQAKPEERHALLFKDQLGAVAEAVPISAYCAGIGVELKRSGAQLVGRCPFPDHEDKTPSWTVWGDRTWHCFGCGRWGDVVSLHADLEGHAEMWSAMVDLSMRYGVELPERSERWKAAQDRKARLLRVRNRAAGNVLARRSFEVLMGRVLAAIEDPAQRAAERELAWSEWREDGDWFWPALADGVLGL